MGDFWVDHYPFFAMQVCYLYFSYLNSEMKNTLKETFGDIDIYLFDQLLKGRFDNCKSVLDAGCGTGRNMVYFLRNGYEVSGADQKADSIAAIKELSQQLAPTNPLENFVQAPVEDLPYKDSSFDLVVCSAVLHFAKNKQHFEKMLHSLWRVLKPGGFLFTRLASSIGIEFLIKDIGNGRFHLPDGSDRYLADEQALLQYTKELGAELFEPIKTTNVQDMRCMTTWCLRKNR